MKFLGNPKILFEYSINKQYSIYLFLHYSNNDKILIKQTIGLNVFNLKNIDTKFLDKLNKIMEEVIII
jgi:hypothetical protein